MTASGLWSMSTANLSPDSETTWMPMYMEHGIQIQIMPTFLNDSLIYMVQVITPDTPYWLTIGAFETPALALTALCRMVGATDTDQ
jgi:hypothetical protein